MIEIKEFVDILVGHGWNEKEAVRVADSMDFDKNGTIEYSEFVSSMLESDHYATDGWIKQLFKFVDKDNDGNLNKSEMLDLLGSMSKNSRE